MYDLKTLADNKQLLNEFPDEESVKNYIERFGKDDSLQFPKDRVIYIRAKVVDPLFTKMLFSMLYLKSKHAPEKPLQALGIEVEEISWDGIMRLNSHEQQIIDQACEILQRGRLGQ